MKTVRFTLIFLHAAIIFYSVNELNPQSALHGKRGNYKQQVASILCFVLDLICIVLYHAASSLVILLTDRNAGIVRATGVLVIGELFKEICSISRYATNVEHIGGGELLYYILASILFLATIVSTFILSENMQKEQNNLVPLRSLTDSVNGILSDTESKHSQV